MLWMSEVELGVRPRAKMICQLRSIQKTLFLGEVHLFKMPVAPAFGDSTKSLLL